jgi:hypothetical protein
MAGILFVAFVSFCSKKSVASVVKCSQKWISRKFWAAKRLAAGLLTANRFREPAPARRSN